MRPIERIKPFMKWLTDEWLQSPDQRFGQLLINLGLIDDGYHWHMELNDCRLPHEHTREFCMWGQKIDYMSHKYSLIKDLEFDHIIAILETQTHISDNLRTILEVELSWRLSNE